jgi:hypothetical protein
VGAIENCEEFGRRLYAEAWRRGWARADKKVVLGDGSDWIWNQAALHFPDAVHIVDLYHSREHLGNLATKLYPQDEPARMRWIMVEKDRLDEGKIEDLVVSLRSLEASHSDLAKDIGQKPTTLKATKNACVTPSFANKNCLSDPGSSKRVANRHWQTQTIGDVLDGTRRQCHHRPPLLPAQW